MAKNLLDVWNLPRLFEDRQNMLAMLPRLATPIDEAGAVALRRANGIKPILSCFASTA